MAGELQLDPDEVREYAARLADLGDRVGHTYSVLREALAQAEGCWGDDRLGTAFAEGFEPSAEQLLTGQHAMEKGLHDTAAAMRSAGDELAYADLRGGSRVARATEDRPATVPGNSMGTPSPPADALQQPAASFGRPPAADGPGTKTPHPVEEPGTAIQNTAGGPTAGTANPVAGPTSATTNPADSPGASRSGNQSSNPATETSSQRGGRAPAESPDRRPRPTPVSLPTGRDVPRNPVITAGPRRTSDAAPVRSPVSTANAQTPWSRPPSSTPGARSDSSTQNSSPQAPRPQPQRSGDPRRDVQQRRKEPSNRSPLFAWLAQALARRHGVEVIGFDMPGLQELPVREFAAAVDRVLTDYPMLVVDVVAVADLGAAPGAVYWRREARNLGSVRSITLDQRTACASSGPASVSDSVAEPERSRLYAETVRAFGVALEDAGGGTAQVKAQHVLIAEYMRGVAGRYTTLAELVRGYRQWRGELIGATNETGRFCMREALSSGFAEVVLQGSRACAPARTLHTLLVDAAPRRD